MAAKVSIIMPIYNGEKAVGKAIESVLNQTMADIELICVDDFSTDASVQVIRQYAEKDSRVLLMRHERNRGPLMARKTGTLMATGKYIMYLDCDDLFVPDACFLAYEAMKKSNADMIHFGTRYQMNIESDYSSETAEILKRDAMGEGKWTGSKTGLDLLERFFINKKLHWATWNKIYTAKLARRIFTLLKEEYITMCEDAMTTFLMLVYAKSVMYLPTQLYVYHLGVGITGNYSMDRVKSIASECYVLQVLSESLTDVQKQDVRVIKALEAFHCEIWDAISWNAFYIEERSLQEVFLTTLLQHCTPIELLRELQRYYMREHDELERLLEQGWIGKVKWIYRIVRSRLIKIWLVR